MKTVKKTTVIREVLALDPGTATILMRFGLHCLGCPHAMMETLEEATAVHGVDVNDLVAQLNAFLAEKH